MLGALFESPRIIRGYWQPRMFCTKVRFHGAFISEYLLAKSGVSSQGTALHTPDTLVHNRDSPEILPQSVSCHHFAPEKLFNCNLLYTPDGRLTKDP